MNPLLDSRLRCAGSPRARTHHCPNLICILGQVHEVHLASNCFFGFTYSTAYRHVTISAADTVSGVLTSGGLQLNLYYVPNTYTYKVQYLELNTRIELADPKQEQVLYGTLVTEEAIEIEKDLDGDGQPEDFRLA